MSNSRQVSFARAIRRALALLSIGMLLLATSPTVTAKQTVLTVKPGWDVFDAGSGYVIYSVTSSQRACKPKLQIIRTFCRELSPTKTTTFQSASITCRAMA